MRKIVGLLLFVGTQVLAACGSAAEPTVQKLQLISVDGKAIPVQIYVDASGRPGRIVGGTLKGQPFDASGFCAFTLSLSFGSNQSGSVDSFGDAACTWANDGNASAQIDLGSPWGKHAYTFVK